MGLLDRRRLGLAAVVLVAAASVSVLAGTGQAAMADPGGLQVTAQTQDVTHPVLLLTNRGSAPCQVVAGALGPIAFTSVEQNAAAVSPVGAEGSIEDGLDTIMEAQLRTLPPGGSLRVSLPVLDWDSGHALQTVAWSPTAGTFATFYPIDTGKPLTVHATYTAPALAVSGAPLCVAVAAASASRTPPATSSSLLIWVAAGVVLILLALLFVVWRAVVWRARRRAAKAGSATVLLLVAGLAVVAGQARPAYATIVPNPSLAAAWAGCSQLLHEPGHDPAGILPTLEDPAIKVEITPALPNAPDYGNGEYGLSKTHMLITWNIDDFHQYAGTGGTADPCDSLYHELYHAYEHAKGTYDHNDCITAANGNTHIPAAEVNATRAQNLLRARLHRDERSHYGQLPMPTGPCLPPPDPNTCHPNGGSAHPAPIVAGEVADVRGAPATQRPVRASLVATGRDGCGDTNGDPHLRTLDGRRYDFQAAGEFVLTRQSQSGFEVQVRQQPFPGSRTVAVNTATAMAVGTDRVEVGLAVDGTVRLLVNGASRPMQPVSLPGGGLVELPARGGVAVIWPDTSRVTVTPIGRWGLHVTAEPAPARDGKLDGLLGDLDGTRDNDIRPRGGKPIADVTYAALYPAFADSWRVVQQSSLFTYDPGTSTATYTDRSFPDPTVPTLPNRSAAEAICRTFGVSDPDVFAACVLDVALTGQPDFAEAAVASQIFAGAAAIGGTNWTAGIAAAGRTDSHTFDGVTGQRLFIDVPSSNLPDQCGVVTVSNPDKTFLTSGCIIGGKGYVDGILLPATGTYTVTVDPAGPATGQASLTLILSQDHQGSISIDGPSQVAIEESPGQITRLGFDATAGQKIFVDVTGATTPDQCGLVAVRAPDDAFLSSGCVIGGRGYVDATDLPVSGHYSLVIDPGARGIGTITLRMISDHDQHGTLVVNAAAVVASIQQPGAVAAFTFTGTAGQQVAIDVTSSTLPDQCGLVAIRDSRNAPINGVCVIGGHGSAPLATLPVTGTYTVLVDPGDRATGSLQVRLHT